MSKWIDFVRQWAKENNTTYGCALSDPKMKEEYYKKNPVLSKEEKKAKKQAEEEARDLRNFKSSSNILKNKFLKPYLANKNDPYLKEDLINKYRKFSQRLKDYIEQNYPNMHSVVAPLAQEKDERQIKKGLKKPKDEPKE